MSTTDATTDGPATEGHKPRARRGDGSVFRRKRRDGKWYPGWWIRHTNALGERHMEMGGPTKETAKATLRKRLDEKHAVRSGAARPVKDVSLKELKESLLEHWHATLTPATVHGRTGFIDRAVTWFGERPMKSIASADVERLLTHLRLSGRKKAATIRHYAAVLSSAWEFAIRNSAAAVNPCRGLRLPRADRRAVPYITDEQRRAIYTNTPEFYRAAVMLLGDAGLRRGEVLDLSWNHVGPEFSNVTVARSKNHKPRIVPTTSRLAEALRVHHDTHAPTRAQGASKLFGFPAHDLNEVVRRASRAAGVPGFTPHMLRHAFASWLARTGTPLTDIARLLGHADIQMAARYAQWAPADAGVRAIAALSAEALSEPSSADDAIAKGEPSST